MWMMWHMADWTHSNPFLTEACCDRLFSVLTPLRHRVRRHVLPQKWTAWWLGIYAEYIMVIVDIMGIIQSWNIQMPDGVWYFTFEIDARKLPRSLLKKIAESSVSDDWACLAVLHFFLVLTWETCLLVWWRLKAFRSELLFANHVSQYWKIYCQHLRQDCQAATFMNMETLTSEPPSCFVGMDFIDFHYLGALGSLPGLSATRWLQVMEKTTFNIITVQTQVESIRTWFVNPRMIPMIAFGRGKTPSLSDFCYNFIYVQLATTPYLVRVWERTSIVKRLNACLPSAFFSCSGVMIWLIERSLIRALK